MRGGTRARRGPGGQRPSLGEVVGLGLMLVPILAVIAVPNPRLGALAAFRKSSGDPALGSLASGVPAPSGTISFIEIELASRSQEYAAEAGISEGTRVEL
ncbi:MAG: hypothetical protein ACRDJ5_10290, partial [Actinomycetota bacterium]